MSGTSPLPYPAARKASQTDLYFDTEIQDPYRWMEDLDAPEVAAWTAEENALTQAWLAEVPERDTIRARLMELTNFERFSAPARRGTRYFYSHNTGLQNQPVVFWQEGLDGEAKVLIDPNTLSADGTVALSGLSVTDDGTLMAYSIAESGSDWIRWRVRDVTTGIDTGDLVQWSKFSSATWLKDNSGFFYEGYDAPAEESLKDTNYFHKVFFHRLGTAQSEDTLVFDRPDDKELNLGAQVTDDGRYLVLSQSRGTSPNNQITILDLESRARHALVTTEEAVFDPIDNIGTVFFFRTTLDAPNSRVIAIDLRQPEREAWRTLIAETGNPLDTVSLVHDLLIAQYLADAQSHIQLYRLDGSAVGALALPAIGTAAGFGGRRGDAETFYTFTNFTTPATVYRLDLATLESTIYRQPKLAYDPTQFETTQVFYASKDGTRIPLFVTHRRGLALDGQNPTILYGYGGFNITLQPAFAPAYVLWMEMGGLYAQAGLRGGGEYGESWHEAGIKRNKQNVFDDFIAGAEYLIASGYTSSPKLAIQGGSNGGLLVAACELQRPELFGAVIAQVGVMDMLRFDKFTIGWAWKADYGSPSEDEAEFRAILAYSPLHNIKAGTAYPPTLIVTADHDDRVFPAHSFKYGAALQEAQAGTNPILIRVETRAGHGGGMPLSKRVELTTDEYSFLVRALGMRTLSARQTARRTLTVAGRICHDRRLRASKPDWLYSHLMKALPYHLGRAVLVIGIFVACALSLWFSTYGFSGFDVSPMIDAGWRVLSGQVPGKDFVITFPASLYLATALSYHFFGITWHAIAWGECILYSVISLLGLRVASTLSPLLGRRDTLLLSAGFVGAQTVLLLSINYLWHSSIAETFAVYAILTTSAVILHAQRSALLSIEFAAHLALAFTGLILSKPNTAYPAILLCVFVLIRARVSYRFLSAVTAVAVIASTVILARVHVSPAGMVRAYMGLTGRLIPKAFVNGILFQLYARYGLANLLVYAILALCGGAIVRLAWMQRRAVLAQPISLLAAGSLAVAIIGMGTNFDFKLTDTPLFLIGLLLFALASPLSIPSFRKDAALCVVLLCLLAAYFGATRFRMQIVGVWADDKECDRVKFDDRFLGHMAACQVVPETLGAIDRTLAAQPLGSHIFFGPSLEFLYARDRVQSPLQLPDWWDSGTSYPKSKEGNIVDAWKKDRFDVLIFDRNNILLLPAGIRSEIASNYTLLPDAKIVSTYVRRTSAETPSSQPGATPSLPPDGPAK